jgi:hypothetical protein
MEASEMKLCQRCKDDLKPLVCLEDNDEPTVPESECEIWLHKVLDGSAATLGDIIDRAFQEEDRAVVSLSRIRELWKEMGGHD